MVRLNHDTDFIRLRVLCCYFLLSLVWVLSATVHGSPAGPLETSQNSSTIVPFISKPVQYENHVIPEWDKNPACHLVVYVSREHDNQYISKSLCPGDCRTIYENIMENKCFENKPIVPLFTNIHGRIYYLVKEFQKLKTQIRLWSEPSTRPENSSKIDLLTKTTGDKIEYLEELVISEKSRSSWSTKPVSGTTILVEGNHGDYVAQTSDVDHWIKFYEATNQTKYTSNTYLRSLVKETTEEIEGKLYYLSQQFQRDAMQFQLWSASSTVMAGGHQVVDLVRRRVGTDTSYLKSITIEGLGIVLCSWVPTPPSFISIAVEDRFGVKYIAEIRKTTNQHKFYKAVAFFRHPNVSFFNDVSQVTTKMSNGTYYLLERIDDFSGAYIELWSKSPVYTENGTQVQLVIKKGTTFTEYLKEVSKEKDDIITRTWSTRPSASTIFRIIDYTGSVSIARLPSKTVLRYLS